jgi:hypothetical protein
MLILQERCEVGFPLNKLSPHCKYADWPVQPSESFHSRCPLS